MTDNSSSSIESANLAALQSAVADGFKYAVFGQPSGRAQIWLAEEKDKDVYRSSTVDGRVGRTDDDIHFYAFRSPTLAEQFREKATRVQEDAVTPVLEVSIDPSPFGGKVSLLVR